MADFPAKTLADWRALAAKELGGKSRRRLAWQTPEGIAVKPLYTAADLEGLEHARHACPASRPICAARARRCTPTGRGRSGNMRASRPPRNSNASTATISKAGQMGLSVAFDLATHRGYDSDHPRVVGDVGKAGVAIDSVEDMKILFDGIPLDKMSVSMTMNGAVLPVLAGFIVAAEEQGVPQEQLQGTIQNDILKEFMVRNTYIYPPEPVDADRRRHHRVHRAAHAEIQLDLDLRLSHAGGRARPRCRSWPSPWPTGSNMSARRCRAGLTIDEFAPRLSFFFGIGMNFFMEIAKLRAARLLWARLIAAVRARRTRRAWRCARIARPRASASPSRTRYNNIVRTTIEALAAVLGGTQSLHTNSFDEALALPTPFSARIARNTQLILAEETGIPHVVDPLGGSYYVESLTACRRRGGAGADRRGRGAGRHDQGGRERHAQAAHRGSGGAAPGAHRPRRGGRSSASTNTSADDDGRGRASSTSTTPGARARRSRGSSRVRATRDPRRVRGGARALTEAARDGQGQSAGARRSRRRRARATVGEISDALEKVFTRHRADHPLGLRRLWRAVRGRRGLSPHPARDRGLRRAPRAAGRACWWSSSARTATTAAPR